MTQQKQQLEERLLELEAGDYMSYELLDKLEKSENLVVEVVNYYQDSTGFLEGWRIGKRGEIVVDGLNHDIMVRKAQHIEEEVLH